MTDTIINFSFAGLFLLGIGTMMFFLVLMCMDEFGRRQK